MKFVYLLPSETAKEKTAHFKKIGFNHFDKITYVYYKEYKADEKDVILFFPGFVSKNMLLKNLADKNRKNGGKNINIDTNNEKYQEMDFTFTFDNNLGNLLNTITENARNIEESTLYIEKYDQEKKSAITMCMYSAKGGVGKTGTSQGAGEATKFYMDDNIKRLVIDFNTEEGSFSRRFVQSPSDYKFEALIQAFENKATDEKLKELLQKIIAVKPSFLSSRIEFPCDVLFSPSENKTNNSYAIYSQTSDFISKILKLLKEMYDLIIIDCHNAKTILNKFLFNYVDHISIIINTDIYSVLQNEEFIKEVLKTETLRKKINIIYNEYNVEEIYAEDEEIVNTMMRIPMNTREIQEYMDKRFIQLPKISRFRKIMNKQDAIFNKEEQYLTEEEFADFVVNFQKLFSNVCPLLMTEKEATKEVVYKKSIMNKILMKLFGDKND